MYGKYFVRRIVETRTIQEAIKQEAKKLVPQTSGPNQSMGRYPGMKEKEFLMPGKVYGTNFTPIITPPPQCFRIPDGFVTPLRSTPHRNLTNTPVSETSQMRAGASAASRTSARMSRVSRQLRGPFGQMLMEEMAKSGAIQDPSEMFLDQQPPDLLGDTQEAGQGPVIFHQRTRSSPSKLMDFSGAMSGDRSAPVTDHNFAALSRDKLTVAQELLVPRTSGSMVMMTGANTFTMVPHFNDSFRRQKVSQSVQLVSLSSNSLVLST